MNDQNPIDFVAQNALVSEESFEGRTLRTVFRENEYWFVANDVVSALGYAETSKAINKFCKGVPQRHPIQTAKRGMQEMRIINKPDLYRLVLKSEAKGAERFQDWVVEDLLPTLEREGSYHMALKAIPSEPWSLEEIDAIVDRERPVDGRPPEPELPFPNFDDHLPQATLSDEEARVEQGYRREAMRTSLQVLRAQYGILLSKYPHFESCVKQASHFGNKDRLKEAEALQEESEKFCKWAWSESMRLGLGPDDLKAVDDRFDIFWRVNFAELFKKHFRKDWQLYIEDERAKLKPYEVSERQRHLYRFK